MKNVQIFNAVPSVLNNSVVPGLHWQHCKNWWQSGGK